MLQPIVYYNSCTVILRQKNIFFMHGCIGMIIKGCTHVLPSLKRTVFQSFRHFFIKKLYLGPIWTGKSGFVKFFVFAKIFAKNVCLHSHLLCWHTVNYFTLEKVYKITIKRTTNWIWYFWKLCVHIVVGIVVDYTDTCWNSHWLRGHDVSIAIDYADTVLA